MSADNAVTADGGVCAWDAGELSVTGLAKALDAIGKTNLFPARSNKSASLQDAMSAFAKKALKPPRGKPIRLFRLGDNVTGFEARQIMPGEKEVDPVPLFSAIADADDKIHIVKHSIPKMNEDGVVEKSEQWMQGFYESRRAVVHSSTVTNVVNKLMTTLHTTPIRQTGGCYWVPDTSLPDIQKFSELLANENTKFKLNVLRSTVSANETVFKSIAESVKQQMKSRLDAVSESLESLDKRQNENGKASRTNECYAIMDLAKEYATFLGNELSIYQKMAKDMEERVSISAAMDFCA